MNNKHFFGDAFFIFLHVPRYFVRIHKARESKEGLYVRLFHRVLQETQHFEAKVLYRARFCFKYGSCCYI